MTDAQWKMRDRYREWLLCAFEGNATPEGTRYFRPETPREWCRRIRISAAECFRNWERRRAALEAVSK